MEAIREISVCVVGVKGLKKMKKNRQWRPRDRE